MKTIIKILVKTILVLIPTFWTPNLFAQKKTVNLAKLTVHILDSTLAKNPLTLSVVRDYINGEIGSDEYTVIADKNGYYRYTVPKLSKLSICRFSFKLISKYFTDGFIEPGDNIFIELDSNVRDNFTWNNFKYSGQGSIKFMVHSMLQNTKVSNLNRVNQDRIPSMKILHQMKSNQDSTYLFYKRILETNNHRISRDFYHLMDGNIYGKSYLPLVNFLAQFFLIYPDANPSMRDSISAYFSKLKKIPFSGFSSFALQSRNYLNYLRYKATTASTLLNGSSKIQDIYREVVSQNNGMTREKALVQLLTMGRAGRKGDNLDSVYADMMQYIKTPKYRTLISQLGNALKVGTFAHPFSLPDSTGKMVSLSDFKGKVVLIDCWFTGCGVCSDVAMVIDKSVLPKYINNENVIFLSINADKSETMWKESIKGGKYTNPKSINLFTEGLALKHPFMKTYKFQGFPKLLLIDKDGKIYSPAVPRDPNEIIALIDRALELQ